MSEVEMQHLSDGGWIETRDLGGGRSHAIRYRKDGSIDCELWLLNDRCHREDAPAEIHYYEDRSIEYEWWYLYGNRHREDGPAVVCYHKDGSIESQYYWLFGHNLRVRTVKGLKKKLCEMICKQVHAA